MSEFSDCYFLRTRDSSDVKKLLTRTRRHGLILPTTRAWIPFLVDGLLDVGGPSPNIVQRNEGLLLHYAYAEDHGFALSLFRDTEAHLRIDVQRRGPSEMDLPGIVNAACHLGLTSADGQDLETALMPATLPALTDIASMRDQLARLWDFDPRLCLSCADLARSSKRDLSKRYPEAIFVLTSLRGRYDKTEQPAPNEFCPVPGLPSFMYLPVPTVGDIDEQMLERHVRHWMSGADFDDDRQVGFWLLNAYHRALPSRYAYLADRVMNLSLAFPTQYELALRETIRAVLAISGCDFDWQPYLTRQAGEQRL
jgi:hypothetical protein